MSRWVKDPKVEHGLRKMGIKWESCVVPIAQIDMEESANRQVRIGKKINDEWILTYAQSMTDGAEFPMPILNQISKLQYFIWSGNHRVRSAELCQDTHVDAYVVKVIDPAICDILPRVVNAWEAQGVMGKDEKLIHAKYLMDHHSMSSDDAARLMCVKREWLTKYALGADVASKIAATGVSPNGLSKSILIKLSPLADNRAVLRETSRFLSKNKIIGDEAVAVIDDVKKQETEKARLDELARWGRLVAERNRPTRVPRPFRSATREKILRGITGLSKLVENISTLSQAQMTERLDVETLKRHWFIIQRQMGLILGSEPTTVGGR